MVENFYIVRGINSSGLSQDFVVLKEKLDDFIEDMHVANYYKELYLFTAAVAFNGSVVTGEYINKIEK